jgi:hypothetical protein
MIFNKRYVRVFLTTFGMEMMLVLNILSFCDYVLTKCKDLSGYRVYAMYVLTGDYSVWSDWEDTYPVAVCTIQLEGNDTHYGVWIGEHVPSQIM